MQESQTRVYCLPHFIPKVRTKKTRSGYVAQPFIHCMHHPFWILGLLASATGQNKHDFPIRQSVRLTKAAIRTTKARGKIAFSALAMKSFRYPGQSLASANIQRSYLEVKEVAFSDMIQENAVFTKCCYNVSGIFQYSSILPRSSMIGIPYHRVTIHTRCCQGECVTRQEL